MSWEQIAKWTMEDQEGFFGDYLARNEPDKILCRAVTFCQKVKWWTLEQDTKILKQVQDDRNTGLIHPKGTSIFRFTP
jgi:hypothetical protein